MGWARGRAEGPDGIERDVGYSIPAFCDFPSCRAWIDRGLGWACGGRPLFSHDEGCAFFFCSRHGVAVTDGRLHEFRWHVRRVRAERRDRLRELIAFRRGDLAIGELKYRWPIWRLLPKSWSVFGMLTEETLTRYYPHATRKTAA